MPIFAEPGRLRYIVHNTGATHAEGIVLSGGQAHAVPKSWNDWNGDGIVGCPEESG